MSDPRSGFEAYAAFFERIAPGNLHELDALVTPDVRFTDPFNEITGAPAYRHVYAHMFQTLDEPRFVIRAKALDGATGFYLWDFSFRRKGKAEQHLIVGTSEVHLAPDGRISAHHDHWDAGQVYEKVPVLGALIRLVKRKLAVG